MLSKFKVRSGSSSGMMAVVLQAQRSGNGGGKKTKTSFDSDIHFLKTQISVISKYKSL